jgi:predicted nucleotidyltransferase component of viral defense system
LAEQARLLHGLAPVLGRRAEILEKDIWLCLALGVLFALPNRKPMAFKGGTSLSKVYQAIERFSEDVDVTIDYRSLVDNVPLTWPRSPATSARSCPTRSRRPWSIT